MALSQRSVAIALYSRITSRYGDSFNSLELKSAFGKDCFPTPLLRELFPNFNILIDFLTPYQAFEQDSSEANCLKSSSIKRKTEFIIGRSCARRALCALKEPARPILRLNDGRPKWPAGIIGSITHCDDMCAAIVSPYSNIQGLGIDIETSVPFERDTHSIILTQSEIINYSRSNDQLPSWENIIFSAKESVYKAIYPTLNRFVDFKEVEISLRITGSMPYGMFTVKATGHCWKLRHLTDYIRGIWLSCGENVFTLACMSKELSKYHFFSV